MNRFEHGGNVWVKENFSEWLDFSANINPYGPPEAIVKALKESIRHINIYPEPFSSTAREELSEYLGVASEFVLPTSGGIQAMELVMRVLSPSHTLIIQPGFVEYERLAMLYSETYENYLAFNEAKGYHLALSNLKEKLKKADLVFLCNPSNPSGQALSKAELNDILTICATHNTRLIIDEAFIHYCLDKTLVNHINQYNNLIIVGSLTKMYSIPGVRLGYLATNKQTMDKIEKYNLPWSLNIFAQTVALNINSEELQNFEKSSVSRNYNQRQYLNTRLKNMNIVAYPSDTNFLLLNIANIGYSSFEITRKLEKHKIMVRECSNFVGLESGNFIRVAVKKQCQNLRLIKALSEVLRCGT